LGGAVLLNAILSRLARLVGRSKTLERRCLRPCLTAAGYGHTCLVQAHHALPLNAWRRLLAARLEPGFAKAAKVASGSILTAGLARSRTSPRCLKGKLQDNGAYTGRVGRTHTRKVRAGPLQPYLNNLSSGGDQVLTVVKLNVLNVI